MEKITRRGHRKSLSSRNAFFAKKMLGLSKVLFRRNRARDERPLEFRHAFRLPLILSKRVNLLFSTLINAPLVLRVNTTSIAIDKGATGTKEIKEGVTRWRLTLPRLHLRPWKEVAGWLVSLKPVACNSRPSSADAFLATRAILPLASPLPILATARGLPGSFWERVHYLNGLQFRLATTARALASQSTFAMKKKGSFEIRRKGIFKEFAELGDKSNSTFYHTFYRSNFLQLMLSWLIILFCFLFKRNICQVLYCFMLFTPEWH